MFQRCDRYGVLLRNPALLEGSVNKRFLEAHGPRICDKKYMNYGGAKCLNLSNF